MCDVDSREIETHGVIIDLQVKLAFHPDITFKMDVLVIGVPDAWGMLLSRKWVDTMGGCIQIEISYETIPLPGSSLGSVKLLREKERKFHIEDLKESMNEFVYYAHDMGCYEVVSYFLHPLKQKFKDEIPKFYSFSDTMDSFDCLFLEEVPKEKNIDIAPSEAEIGSDVLVGSDVSYGSTSTCQD